MGNIMCGVSKKTALVGDKGCSLSFGCYCIIVSSVPVLLMEALGVGALWDRL